MSRQITLTGMARWKITQRSRRRLVEKADLAVVGIDDDISRAIANRLIKSGKRVIRVSVNNTPVEDSIVLDGTCLLRYSGGRSAPVADLGWNCFAARQTQWPECRRRRRCAWAAWS